MLQIVANDGGDGVPGAAARLRAAAALRCVAAVLRRGVFFLHRAAAALRPADGRGD